MRFKIIIIIKRNLIIVAKSLWLHGIVVIAVSHELSLSELLLLDEARVVALLHGLKELIPEAGGLDSPELDCLLRDVRRWRVLPHFRQGTGLV